MNQENPQIYVLQSTWNLHKHTLLERENYWRYTHVHTHVKHVLELFTYTEKYQ